MQQVAIVRAGAAPSDFPLLRRFVTKLVVDVLPATLTSIAGGLLVAHYQFGFVTARPAAQPAAHASAEMVQLVRDEHTAIMDYIKAETAAEKSRNAAADAANARAAAEARAIVETPVAPPVRPTPVSAVAPKAVAVRTSKPAAAVQSLPPHEPLIVAQAVPAPAPAAQPAPPSKSLLDRTLDLKDHVVGATLHAVSAIGGIPSWIASIGNHSDNADTAPKPAANDAGGRSFAS